MIHRPDVIAHLQPVVAFLLRSFFHIRLRAFDATGCLRFLYDVYANEAVDIWDDEGKCVQCARNCCITGKQRATASGVFASSICRFMPNER